MYLPNCLLYVLSFMQGMAPAPVTLVAMESVFPQTMSVITTWTAVMPVTRPTAHQPPSRTLSILDSCHRGAPTQQASLVHIYVYNCHNTDELVITCIFRNPLLTFNYNIIIQYVYCMLVGMYCTALFRSLCTPF